MTSREQTLSFILIGALVLIVGGAGGYVFVLQPLQRQQAAEIALNQEILDLEGQVDGQAKTTQRLTVARARSLPADESMAKREYTVALERLIEGAGVPKGYTISPKAVDNSSRAVPELSKGKPIYTKVAYELVFKKVDTWMLKEFLEQYYRLGMLHQITSIIIKKDDEVGSKNTNRRNDLTVTITTEAILVDGAENRRTLLPVPTAFAAIGGGAIYKGMTATPEGGRGVVPPVQVPILATNPRDYSLIVMKDPFNGPLPPPPPLPKFTLAKIGDTKIETDKAPAPVKVLVTGEGSQGAKITAIASGTLFAEGALKVDPKTFAIELPKTSATEGTATIAVIATSADGTKTEKTSFKVSLEDPKVVEVPKGEDLSAVIILIGITPRSDGTAWARIVDNANRHRYQIDATPKSITVRKEWTYGPDRPWKTDTDHDKLPAGVMELPETTKTTRTFKLIAVNGDGLVLADIKPGGAPRPEAMKGPPGPPKPVKQPANPLAAVGGNMAVAVSPPKYYRWSVGQPLSGIKLIPDAEIKQILKTAEAIGPVFDVAVGP